MILVLKPFCWGSVSTKTERVVEMKYRIAVARRRGLDECTRWSEKYGMRPRSGHHKHVKREATSGSYFSAWDVFGRIGILETHLHMDLRHVGRCGCAGRREQEQEKREHKNKNRIRQAAEAVMRCPASAETEEATMGRCFPTMVGPLCSRSIISHTLTHNTIRSILRSF